MSPLLANIVFAIHVAFILGVILPVPLIVIGGIKGWRWVRNLWFRLIHLGMIGFVAAEAAFGMMCPLTIWENALRIAAGEAGPGDSFLAYWTHRLVFWDLPEWAFTLIHIGFAAIIVGLFVFVPPRLSKTTKTS